MARYEATGEPTLRAAAENFWAEVSSQHTFATGGSTTGEVWLRAGSLGDAVAPQRKENYWAHDQAETCVAHNSMRVSRRLLQWSPWAAWERPLRHAAYYERTLYNAVLGTQRGRNPGEMLYMMPCAAREREPRTLNQPQWSWLHAPLTRPACSRVSLWEQARIWRVQGRHPRRAAGAPLV